MASIPQWHSDMRRKFPRVAFTTVVEVETPEFVAYGYSENISLRGMLVRCESGFLPGTPVVVKFVPPGSERVEIQSRVAHCRPGVRVGLEFLNVAAETEALLSKLAQPPAIAIPRRSARVPLRFIVELRWLKAGQPAQVAAETVLVSRHGCLLLTEAELEVGASVAVFWPDAARATQARVVSRKTCAGDSPRVALEFISVEDFWNLDFSATA